MKKKRENTSNNSLFCELLDPAVGDAEQLRNNGSVLEILLALRHGATSFL